MIDAKLKGEGIDPASEDEPDTSNVVDLMAALKKSLGQPSEKPPAGKAASGKTAPKSRKSPAATPARKPARKRA